MELSQDSGVSSPERRSEKRRKSRVNKLVYAGVCLGEQETRDFLYLVDISTGGMRVNLPRLYEVESRICLSMPTEPYLGHGSPELVAECRVAWNRSILGGT